MDIFHFNEDKDRNGKPRIHILLDHVIFERAMQHLAAKKLIPRTKEHFSDMESQLTFDVPIETIQEAFKDFNPNPRN
jgi:hypothetical protein